jgi:MFS family permease
MLVAWALGGPLLGTASERMRRRKPLYVLTCALAVLAWAVLVFAPPLPLPALLPLLLALGFVSGSIIIGFAYAKESVPLRLAGTSSGVTNMGVMLGGMVLQPAVGWMLDRHWQGALSGGVRIYDYAAYQAGFLLMLGWVVVSLILISLTRETHCKQSA